MLHPVGALADDCRFEPGANRIVCNPTGEQIDEGSGPGPGTGTPVDDDPGLRYVYTATDPGIGACYYWSNVVGGLDAWDPANDAAVIAVTLSLPECPPGVVDPEVRAWSVFRSWDLQPPNPSVSPPDQGVTGLPSHIEAPVPVPLVHDEVLPDGRPLQVRASVKNLTVAWGDGTAASHDPSEATGYPDGSVSHVYELKTCTATYRDEHPSGGLCHPMLEAYLIDVSWVWVGEFNVGAGWVPLGTLTRTAQTPYEVDEVRGITVP